MNRRNGFSKLKMLKSYLRTTMTQDRLNGLALIAIENGFLDKVDYEELVEDFVSKNAVVVFNSSGNLIFSEPSHTGSGNLHRTSSGNNSKASSVNKHISSSGNATDSILTIVIADIQQSVA
ncbi:hypothetical protein OSB04_un001104 [Centaurea solstitialis]|uniref:Uncharacterized protein n=1 Tax=Centaurea solstitialis TaxID=347529 RepID=A0AA38SMC2_9ASTR|nr:hypothetical protein OSB04_un001104 [Centaurea solstitialis]